MPEDRTGVLEHLVKDTAHYRLELQREFCREDR
jgi:hypothetical protein